MTAALMVSEAEGGGVDEELLSPFSAARWGNGSLLWRNRLGSLQPMYMEHRSCCREMAASVKVMGKAPCCIIFRLNSRGWGKSKAGEQCFLFYPLLKP